MISDDNIVTTNGGRTFRIPSTPHKRNGMRALYRRNYDRREGEANRYAALASHYNRLAIEAEANAALNAGAAAKDADILNAIGWDDEAEDA